MPETPTLPAGQLALMNAYWRAANYLSVGQVYLLANPLLREKLTMAHVKKRLLGHWGTVPGLNFLYVHLNRVIKAQGLNVLFIAGPGHGAPGVVANTWLEGTYSETYPEVSADEEAWAGCSASSPSPAASPATARRTRRAPSTRAASWATRCLTPTAPCSTTPA